MKNKNIIYSLHRPFHKSLVSVKWVCMYIKEMEKKKKKVVPSSFYTNFFFYLINILNKKYKTLNISEDIEGVPTQKTINEVISHFSAYTTEEKSELLKDTLANRKTDLDKKIYSTYKATSYYINLAKDKFELINEKYQLKESGKNLVFNNTSFFSLTKREEEIIFERILFSDFHMIIPLTLSLKSIKKNKWKVSNIHLNFIENTYGINYFKYTQRSINANYDNVRLGWLDSLDLLDKNQNIRKRYLDIILDNNDYKEAYYKMIEEFSRFEKENLISQNQKWELFNKFENSYYDNISKGTHDQNFVNIYDIKKYFHLSFENFEKLLNEFYESERRKRLILYSNTVTSIDKRKRFYVRNKPVIKIKIF